MVLRTYVRLSLIHILRKFLDKDGVKKIICTYDKVDKLIPVINPLEFKILVDEYHNLLKPVSYTHLDVYKRQYFFFIGIFFFCDFSISACQAFKIERFYILMF